MRWRGPPVGVDVGAACSGLRVELRRRRLFGLRFRIHVLGSRVAVANCHTRAMQGWVGVECKMQQMETQCLEVEVPWSRQLKSSRLRQGSTPRRGQSRGCAPTVWGKCVRDV